jgi:hypothetical protein
MASLLLLWIVGGHGGVTVAADPFPPVVGRALPPPAPPAVGRA